MAHTRFEEALVTLGVDLVAWFAQVSAPRWLGMVWWLFIFSQGYDYALPGDM